MVLGASTAHLAGMYYGCSSARDERRAAPRSAIRTVTPTAHCSPVTQSRFELAPRGGFGTQAYDAFEGRMRHSAHSPSQETRLPKPKPKTKTSVQIANTESTLCFGNQTKFKKLHQILTTKSKHRSSFSVFATTENAGSRACPLPRWQFATTWPREREEIRSAPSLFLCWQPSQLTMAPGSEWVA